jgi:hypothetical protein
MYDSTNGLESLRKTTIEPRLPTEIRTSDLQNKKNENKEILISNHSIAAYGQECSDGNYASMAKEAVLAFVLTNIPSLA